MNRQLWPTVGCVKGTRADAPYFYLGRSLEFVPIHRAVHQVEELRFRQLALLGHLGEKIIRNLSHSVARLGFRLLPDCPLLLHYHLIWLWRCCQEVTFR